MNHSKWKAVWALLLCVLLCCTMALAEESEAEPPQLGEDIDQLKFQGSTYGVPFANNGKWMFYNKKMLADGGYDAPVNVYIEARTIQEFNDIIEIVRDAQRVRRMKGAPR